MPRGSRKRFSHWVIRFWRYVEFADDGCWLWTGTLHPNGYGVFTIGRRPDGTQAVGRAHRITYELVVGPVPPGLEVDHLCRNRACVNPAHLEAVTHAENIWRVPPEVRSARSGEAAKTHCPQGHPYSGDNLYVHNGSRNCRACRRQKQAEYVARRRAKA